jgi:hypothetical protein
MCSTARAPAAEGFALQCFDYYDALQEEWLASTCITATALTRPAVLGSGLELDELCPSS